MHEIKQLYYDEKTDKKKIIQEANKIARSNSDNNADLPNDIRFFENVVCDNEAAARDFINQHDRGWYDQIAVKYMEPKNYVYSKKLTELEDRVAELQKKISDINRTPHFKDAKSAFIGCKNCGSKINSDYLQHSNYCPVCRKDLRPKTVLDRIKKLQDNLKNTREKAKTERNRLESKAPKKVMWLVKIEYHV